jgi:hypothetical protein
MDFDRFWVLQGKTVALQCRYSEAAESPGLEIEEVRATLDDLYRLIAPLSRPVDTQYTLDQNAFADSLTPEEQRQMINGGLPFAQLGAEKQKAWLRLTAANAYATHVSELRSGKLCFDAWPRVTLADVDPAQRRLQQLSVWYPDPVSTRGKEPLNIMVPGKNRRPREIRGEGKILATVGPRLPGALLPSWKLDVAEVGPEELAAKLSAAAGPKLAAPKYAGDRRLWICSGGASRGEVLGAIGLLWGWTLSPAQTGLRLERPAFAPAKDPVDLHRKMQAALPPDLRHMIAAAQDEAATEPLGQQMDRILQAAEAVGGRNWTELRVEQLDETARRRLANQIARTQVGRWYLMHGKREQPPAWLPYPERGVFRLNEEIGPGRHPELMFWVATGPTQRSGWGWAIGTSKFVPSPRR